MDYLSGVKDTPAQVELEKGNDCAAVGVGGTGEVRGAGEGDGGDVGAAGVQG
jgi:hypothetical protein